MVIKRTGNAQRWRALPRGNVLGFGAAWLGLLALTVAGFGANAPRRSFDLAAGEAAVTLKTFSKQSGDEIIYPADQVRAIKTNGVTGELAPREALERMLDGTGLIAVQDEKTGAFAVRQGAPPVMAPGAAPVAAPPANQVPIVLPPLFVEASRISSVRWRYAKLPGMEFLSCADDDITEQLIERVYHLNQRLEAFLPTPFRVQMAVPTTFVLYGETQQPVEFKVVIGDMPRVRDPARGGAPVEEEELTVRYLPNFRFSDRDELAVFYIPRENIAGEGTIHLNDAFVRYLMENRTPPLPHWFMDGLMALYQNSSLDVEPIYSWDSPAFAPEDLTADKFPYESALVRLPNWMFGFETKKLLEQDRHWQPKLRPLAEIFSAPPPVGNSLPGMEGGGPVGEQNQRYVLWWSQAALFIDWAFNNEDGKTRAALWKFVGRASAAPVTETVFRECFGLSYAEMEKTLAEYFAVAVRKNIRVNSQLSAEMPLVTLREASDAEISRIKGNLERLEISYVAGKYPGLAPRYLAHARRTLRWAYDRGSRDPGLLEVMGLCECDAGDDRAARPYLEAAVQTGAARPRVFYELARIKFEELRARDAAAKFTAKQTADLLELLFAARSKVPPLPEVYELIASVWLHSSVPPQRGNLAVLDEGIRFFPGNLRLIYATAVLNATHGFGNEAAVLIKLGLQIAPEGPDRARFMKLQSASAVAD